MIWDREPASGRMSQNDMASSLMIERVANFTEGLDCLRSRTNRQPAHIGTSTTASVIGAGMGSPCFFKLSR